MNKIGIGVITSAMLLGSIQIQAEEVNLEAISVTATKIETATKEVSASIAVIDEKTIDDRNVLNIQDAIKDIPGVITESASNSPSPRLIIRGAGLKARYGVREIMVMKDGVPMTDPDSFTRFDFIDMQDVTSVEVQKGPGSINALNTTGGVIQLLTKSVFSDDKNRIKLGIGNDGQYNANLKVRGSLTNNDFVSFTFSTRANDNSWRDNNDYDSTQGSLKYGHIFEDDSALEAEFSYTESNVNLPTPMTEDEFEVFKDTGEQHDTSYQWQNSARDSKIFAINAKYEKEIGDVLLKPKFYFNTWDHFHPVTGMINDANDNSVYGTDIEMNYSHTLFDKEASLVTGITYKVDITKDAEKYEYADLLTKTVVPRFGPPRPYEEIIRTLSNNKGGLSQTEDSRTTLYGFYLLETFSPTDELSIDASARFDKLSFDMDGNEITAYDYSSKSYMSGAGLYSIDKTYNLFSAKLGAVYKLTESTNIYASAATGDQAPTGSEIEAAQDEGISLDKSTSVNFEIGLKTRMQDLFVDLALYHNDVDDEIIRTQDASGNILYDNAGKTRKKGLELTTVYNISNAWEIGGAYAYSDYKFVIFEEQVGYGSRARWESRDGNYLPYIPKNQYSLFAALNMDNGFKGRVTTRSWGSYYMDNANTEKYEGFDLVTDLMIGYEYKTHNIQLNVNNLTSEYYAMEALKDANGNVTYKGAAPRSAMVTYSYKF